ncbi:hypothetical protein [Mucilaginibacter paludis]|uniref:Uncharacterized protein n=1 Tax=Mucilaginibacter paludis DSM 18603 TaxID=714943 RepID=H1Y8V5_9SPHI|nr:hypothetical protein [Mucilaginibacter paludis]EHQ28721.1 hypothetical protein Mucpa_4633 [Mucilaginibacter paludis DSM 18603]
MTSQSVEFKAMEYVYDLANCAKENGFKTGEQWDVSVASAEEKIAIENKYNPTVSVKVLPAVLSEMFHLVKGKLVMAKTETEVVLDANSIRQNQLQYLVAYNSKRERR